MKKKTKKTQNINEKWLSNQIATEKKKKLDRLSMHENWKRTFVLRIFVCFSRLLCRALKSFNNPNSIQTNHSSHLNATTQVNSKQKLKHSTSFKQAKKRPFIGQGSQIWLATNNLLKYNKPTVCWNKTVTGFRREQPNFSEQVRGTDARFSCTNTKSLLI